MVEGFLEFSLGSIRAVGALVCSCFIKGSTAADRDL